MTKFWQWIRLHPRLSVLLPLCVSIILLNLVAYRQAYAMLNFSPIGKRTDPPESLSFWQKVKTLLLGVKIPKPVNYSTPADWDLPFEVHRLRVKDAVELEA
ncbi:MAG TPA: hypothetical protein VEC93_02630 [Anaerolineae bacterium]|nr:hypothetical protein [Anaerolineae bacterium]